MPTFTTPDHFKVWAGDPIRYPVEDKGRHVPASQDQWLKVYSLDSSDVKFEDAH